MSLFVITHGKSLWMDQLLKASVCVHVLSLNVAPDASAWQSTQRLYSQVDCASVDYPSDPYNLVDRFIVTHKEHFELALDEIEIGRKVSHWSWFVFPTPPFMKNGVEAGSPMNRYYALRTEEEAQAFLQFPTTQGINLRKNYLQIMTSVTQQLETPGQTPWQLVGHADTSKLKSSLKLFEYISRTMEPVDEEVNSVCRQTLAAIEASDETKDG